MNPPPSHLPLTFLSPSSHLPPQDYYEAVKRFQTVLQASGINSSLRSRGIKEGDSVVINEAEFAWQEDQSDTAIYQSYIDDMKSRGRNVQGLARWPHADPKSN